MGYIEGVARNQMMLFPDVVDDYIEDNNPVRFIDAFVDSLDLGRFGFTHAETEDTGRPPYDPSDLLKLYIYGYLNRIRSSRGLEKETRRNIELMWLLRKLTPDFKTIADFRRDNKKAIKKVCSQFILLCKRLNLLSGELVAIDGSKFKAVNSKKRNFNKKKLGKKIREIDEKIEAYISDLDENDREERTFPSVKGEGLKEKVKLLKKRKEKYNELLKGLDESGQTQISLTDTDSRLMVNNHWVDVCYNVQTTADSKHKLILDYEVTNEREDSCQLSKMSRRAKEILGVERLDVLADKGYYNWREIKECVDNGITLYIPEVRLTVPKKRGVPKPEFYKDKFTYDAGRDIYICPMGNELTFKSEIKYHGKVMKLYKSEECFSCPSRHKCTRNRSGKIIYRWEHEEVLEEMRERVEREREKVKMRQLLIEHIFGTIKRNFNQGYFLMRGKGNVSAEMGLTVLAYNIKRVLKILRPERLIGVMKAMNKGISDNLEGIFVGFVYLFAKIKDFTFRWLKSKQIEMIYA